VQNIRKPAVAGQFYPSDARAIDEAVAQYISQSGVDAAPDRVAAIVAPHAGYIYSGPTAGYAYARVRGKRPTRVILLGCGHHYPIETASVWTSGTWQTPVGDFPVDEPFAQSLAQYTNSTSTTAHLPEHALEVQLPFLKAAVGLAPIVPVLFGGPASQWHVDVGEELARRVAPDDLVIASTDLSHFLSQAVANQIDQRTIDAVLEQDTAAVIAGLNMRECSMCGSSAVVATMAFAKARGATNWSLLDYRTSAETSGDYTRVVGYAAISMETAA